MKTFEKVSMAEDMKSILKQSAERWGNKVAITVDEYNQELTFLKLENKSNAIANMLLSIGVQFGDHVAIMLKNRAEFPLTWLALAKIGAVMIPINVQYQEY